MPSGTTEVAVLQEFELAGTHGQGPIRLCKPEVTGSIPVRSIGEKPGNGLLRFGALGAGCEYPKVASLWQVVPTDAELDRDAVRDAWGEGDPGRGTPSWATSSHPCRSRHSGRRCGGSLSVVGRRRAFIVVRRRRLVGCRAAPSTLAE
jgi:hypothetical protein